MGIEQKTDVKTIWLARIGMVTALAVILAVIWMALPTHQAAAGTLTFFTDDDGATWFADSVNNIPPFMHNGKQAVAARMYQTGDNKPFVAYLEKYTDDAKARLEAGRGNSATPRAGPMTAKNPTMESSGLLVKKPHEGKWVPVEDEGANAIRTFTAPDGSMNYLPLQAP